jgi:hypothetical protein
MLGKNQLNNEELNSAPESQYELNSWELNSLPLNGFEAEPFSATAEAQTIGYITQTVGRVFSAATVGYITQDVQLYNTYSGSIGTVTQEVINTQPSQSIGTIVQNVRLTGSTTHLSRYGWNMDLLINGGVINPANIRAADTFSVKITKEEGQSTLCTFDLLLSSGLLDYVETIDGKDVVVWYQDSTGYYPLFVGKLDDINIDLTNKFLSLSASNRRNELLQNIPRATIDLLGRYSEHVQGKYEGIEGEVAARLQASQQSVDFTSTNVAQVTSWYAKATADYTYGASDIFYRDPSTTWQSRTNVINTIDIAIDYSYTRLYHYQRNFNWTAPYKDNIADWLIYRYDIPTIGLIEKAVENSQWKKIGLINFEFTWEPQTVEIERPTGGTALASWTKTLKNGVYRQKFDEEGVAIKDPSGNNTYTYVKIADGEEDLINTLQADFTMATRFSGTVKETYNLTVQAPQSITKYGVVDNSRNFNVSNPYDIGSWESYSSLTPAPSNAVAMGDSYYINEDTNRDALHNAVLTAIDIAKTEIINSHRGTMVSIQVPLEPTIELSHTVEIDTTFLQCKGKVKRIIHCIDVSNKTNNYTQIDIVLMRAAGSVTETPINVPSAPSDGSAIPSATIYLESHYGLDPETTANSDSWSGHIGNKDIWGTMGYVNGTFTGRIARTNFQEQFRVDTPSIPDNLRQERDLTTSATYNIAINNDELSSD